MILAMILKSGCMAAIFTFLKSSIESLAYRGRPCMVCFLIMFPFVGGKPQSARWIAGGTQSSFRTLF